MATFPAHDASAPPSLGDFATAARALGGEANDNRCHFTRGGRRFVMRWKEARKNAPPEIELSTDAGPVEQPQQAHAAHTAAAATEMGPFRSASSPRIPSPAPLTLRLETRTDRAGKSLRINRETQTGDAAFDERVYLESDAPDAAVLAALADPLLRASVVKSLELGAVSMTLDREGSLIISRPLRQASLLELDQLTPLIDALGAAADAIPPLVTARPASSPAGRFTIVAVVTAIVSLVLFFLVDWLWEPLGPDLYASCAVVGFVLWLIALPILVFVLRGRSDSLRLLATTVIALAFVLPLGATDLMLVLNGLFDRSAPIAHEARVISQRSTSGKHTTYYITIESWHPGEAKLELTVGSSLHSRAPAGTALSLTTTRGYLGWERLIRITPPGRDD